MKRYKNENKIFNDFTEHILLGRIWAKYTREITKQ